MNAETTGFDPLTVETVLGRDWAVLTVSGELDMLTAPDLAAILEAVIGRGRTHIAVDTAGVEFIDGRGLDALVRCAMGLAGRGSFAVTRPSAPVRRILSITDMDKVVNVRYTRPVLTAFDRRLDT